jgi:hypothetical protein
MPASGETVNPSLRKILADSHVSAVAIAVLLYRSLDYAIWVLWGPLSLGIFTFPNFPRADRFTLFTTFSYLFYSVVCLAAAGLLSRWVYGMGPLRSLSKYRTMLARRNHV